MLGRNPKHRLFDDKRCFELWTETSSCSKAAKRLQEDGVVNPITGKCFTSEGVRLASLRYIFENMDEGRAAMTAVFRNNGEILTDMVWYFWIGGRARARLTKKRLKKFLEDHPYLVPYV